MDALGNTSRGNTRTAEIDVALETYLKPKPVMVVISGPSGVGKDAVIKCMRRSDTPYHFIVTATDRPIRPGEVDGVDYLFYTTAEFERMIAADEFLEYANVYGQYKGVPRTLARQALASGIDVVMRVDVQGAATLRRLVPGAVTIFLAPPSLASLEQRLRRRATDSDKQVQQRLETATAEFEQMHEFDYVVINHDDDVEGAAQAVAAIVQSVKCCTRRTEIVL